MSGFAFEESRYAQPEEDRKKKRRRRNSWDCSGCNSSGGDCGGDGGGELLLLILFVAIPFIILYYLIQLATDDNPSGRFTILLTAVAVTVLCFIPIPTIGLFGEHTIAGTGVTEVYRDT